MWTGKSCAIIAALGEICGLAAASRISRGHQILPSKTYVSSRDSVRVEISSKWRLMTTADTAASKASSEEAALNASVSSISGQRSVRYASRSSNRLLQRASDQPWIDLDHQGSLGFAKGPDREALSSECRQVRHSSDRARPNCTRTADLEDALGIRTFSFRRSLFRDPEILGQVRFALSRPCQ